MTEDVIELRPSLVRRVLSSAILGLVGLMFWWGAISNPDMVWSARAMMAAVGALWLWGGFELWRGTARAVILTESGLMDSSGVEIAAIDSITGMERGVFSMKPSNGMLLKLSKSESAKWVPGLWWRVGARVGIGGLTPKSQTKAFADVLETRLILKTQ